MLTVQRSGATEHAHGNGTIRESALLVVALLVAGGQARWKG